MLQRLFGMVLLFWTVVVCTVLVVGSEEFTLKSWRWLSLSWLSLFAFWIGTDIVLGFRRRRQGVPGSVLDETTEEPRERGRESESQNLQRGLGYRKLKR